MKKLLLALALCAVVGVQADDAAKTACCRAAKDVAADAECKCEEGCVCDACQECKENAECAEEACDTRKKRGEAVEAVEYVLDEDGNPVLDEDGNPVVAAEEAAE